VRARILIGKVAGVCRAAQCSRSSNRCPRAPIGFRLVREIEQADLQLMQRHLGSDYRPSNLRTCAPLGDIDSRQIRPAITDADLHEQRNREVRRWRLHRVSNDLSNLAGFFFWSFDQDRVMQRQHDAA
jgi:hypothetical protein